MSIKTVEWKNNKLRLIDQTVLPIKERYIDFNDHLKVCKAIKDLLVRGAPAIGVAAAFGVVVGAREYKKKDARGLKRHLA